MDKYIVITLQYVVKVSEDFNTDTLPYYINKGHTYLGEVYDDPRLDDINEQLVYPSILVREISQ